MVERPHRRTALSTCHFFRGLARRIGNWGIAYANRRGVSANITLSSETAKLFTDGGLDLFSEIEGDRQVVSVDDYDFELGDLWEGVTVAGHATLANLPKRLPFLTNPCVPMKWASPGLGQRCGRLVPAQALGFALWVRHTLTFTPKREKWWPLEHA